MKHIIDRELFCRCQKCEDAVRDILRMETMLCHGAKTVLFKRREEIKRAKRSRYDQKRYARLR